ncbi:MAG: peptidoglycan DD-metalloendopeptidase family protein, partial [Gaiellaceae bacterium]
MRRLAPLLGLLGCALALAGPAQAWSWPADGAVLATFRYDLAHPYEGGQHRGVDVAGEPGSTVRAAADGSVSFAGSVPGSGRVVTVQTPDGYAVTLVGLGSIGVSKGASVSEGQAVGTIDGAGNGESPVPHVHLGIRVESDPKGYVDPLSFLPARAPAAEPTTPAEPGEDGGPSSQDAPGEQTTGDQSAPASDEGGDQAPVGTEDASSEDPAPDPSAEGSNDPVAPPPDVEEPAGEGESTGSENSGTTPEASAQESGGQEGPGSSPPASESTDPTSTDGRSVPTSVSAVDGRGTGVEESNSGGSTEGPAPLRAATSGASGRPGPSLDDPFSALQPADGLPVAPWALDAVPLLRAGDVPGQRLAAPQAGSER